MNSFAKNSFAIIIEETVLGKERSGVGRISEGDGEGRSGLDVHDGLDVAVAHIVEIDCTVGFSRVVELLEQD